MVAQCGCCTWQPGRLVADVAARQAVHTIVQWNFQSHADTGVVAHDPYVLHEDMATLLTRALEVASNAAQPWPVRGHAARMARLLAPELPWDDRLALRAVEAAEPCILAFPYAHDLLIAARAVADDDSVLVGPMLEYCATAYERSQEGAVVTALAELARLNAFRGDVPQEWFFLAARAARHEAAHWLRRLLVRWVRRFGAEHEGIRAVVRARADEWLPVRRFRVDVLRAIHAAEPTPAGWVALALQREELRPGPLGLSFGGRQEDAVLALRVALLRRLPADALAALERWSRELAE